MPSTCAALGQTGSSWHGSGSSPSLTCSPLRLWHAVVVRLAYQYETTHGHVPASLCPMSHHTCRDRATGSRSLACAYDETNSRCFRTFHTTTSRHMARLDTSSCVRSVELSRISSVIGLPCVSPPSSSARRNGPRRRSASQSPVIPYMLASVAHTRQAPRSKSRTYPAQGFPCVSVRP